MAILGFGFVVAAMLLIVAVLRWLNSLAARARQAPDRMIDAPHFDLQGKGKFAVAIVGESHYQDALRAVVGAKEGYVEHHCHALLICEDSNPYDANAVRVDIDGHTVGYLPREYAPVYRQLIADGGFGKANGKCMARIYGGSEEKPSYGVWLDL